jgi:hypothetical protein
MTRWGLILCHNAKDENGQSLLTAKSSSITGNERHRGKEIRLSKGVANELAKWVKEDRKQLNYSNY